MREVLRRMLASPVFYCSLVDGMQYVDRIVVNGLSESYFSLVWYEWLGNP